ncbi:MAG TPA: N-acetyl sugar amidotransferase, partial [Candidatus Fermentibacter daniensis]|nr:N-acetyl sugar amidotransferase [Candidatus Fermentibacter daniensis]HQM41676.1 N-acetyl sugar amidotransferase [Candidatus Fermentibacter daniensis]
MSDEKTRCTRCILPADYPNVSFDADGVCRVCREHDVRYGSIDWEARERTLGRILDRYRGRGLKYDCMVPFSGGKDSTFTLWTIKNRYGMNPLAFNFDNGFLDSDALSVVKKSCRKLGVDLYTYTPDTGLLNRVYRRALEQTGEFCSACVVLMPTAIFRAADIHGIRLIVAGFSDELEAPPRETSYMDRTCFWNIMKGGFSRKELKWDFFFPSWKRMFGVKQINLPDYIRWDLPMIYETLNRELDFGRSMASVRYDCLGTPHSSYLFSRRTGFGKYEYLYSNMVRAGVISREEALRIVAEREPKEPPEGFDDFLA